MQVTDQLTRQHSPVPSVGHRDDVPALPRIPRPTHAPHLHADTTGMHYTCTGTGCTYTTPRVPHADPQAAEQILDHCGHPVPTTRRIPDEAVRAARSRLHDAQLLLNRRRRLGYSRCRRTELSLAGARALLAAAGGGAQ